MGDYDPNAIVDSYTEHDEISRVVSSPDGAIMFHIERWFIERYLPESGTVIDVGGGPGRFSVEIAKLGRDVLLTDITPRHIEQAKQLAEEAGVSDRIVDYRTMDICDLSGFGDDELSMAVCYGMLNYNGAVRHVWARGRLAAPSYREREAKPVKESDSGHGWSSCEGQGVAGLERVELVVAGGYGSLKFGLTRCPAELHCGG